MAHYCHQKLIGKIPDEELGDLNSGPNSATNCYVTFPVPFWACLLGSLVGIW